MFGWRTEVREFELERCGTKIPLFVSWTWEFTGDVERELRTSTPTNLLTSSLAKR
jgi:hypothetical protein